MNRTIIIEAAAKAADGLDTIQLISTIVIGVAAIGVPAAFAVMDRRSKAADVKLRARSFALAWYDEVTHLRDYLAKNVRENPKGLQVQSHAAIQEALLGAKESRIPVADLYLLGEAAEPLQRAFSLIRMAQFYDLRRATFAQQGKNIDELDSAQSQQLAFASDEIGRALEKIHALLK
ncbi:hypothetical protein [Stenotrophomonas sp. 364]|uniref:hypothetical protein n=1 Tax=Stenotrophomonas sp. 364 TaxID=2691571 RepID=UPI00131642B9|nr:hypothetical protein [Stenotrophomonas sp. 364]QHB72040.1 hypothetical protein GQ674_12380 [Stenotrophomonas sp. 364]